MQVLIKHPSVGFGRNWHLRSILLTVAFSLLALTADAARYYVSPSGSDNNAGTSPQQPWRSISRVNATNLAPGDEVFFAGGATFPGTLTFTSGSGGTSAAPITFGSYGSGRATISPGNGSGFTAYNAAGFRLQNLVFRGSGMSQNRGTGIDFFADVGTGTKLPFIRIEDVEVTGFGFEGIKIGSWNGTGGFRDIRITNVAVHGNRKDGLMTYSQGLYGLEDVYVGHSRFFNNPGIGGSSNPTGSGVVLGGVNRAVIEHCVSYENGAANTNPAGPIGIWAYNSHEVIIQFSEAFNNRSQGGDGGGFDLDGGVTNSVLQYNYSHGNDGAGYGLFQYDGAPPFGNNTIRYNISQNDGRRHLGGIGIWGASSSSLVQDSRIHNNVVFMAPSPSGSPRPAILLYGGHYRNVHFYNNVVITSGGIPLVEASPATDNVTFQGNNYWSSGDTFEIKWGNTRHSSLPNWRGATGQEIFDGKAIGSVLDPKLADPGGGAPIMGSSPLDSLSAYRLQSDSPMADAGLDLLKVGIDPGLQDFFGNPIPAGLAIDIGVHELEPSDSGGEPAFTYQEWQALHFSEAQRNDPTVSGDEADPAGDGIANLLKYALGLSPWSPSAESLPQASVDSRGLLTLSYTRPIDRHDVEYEVQVSHDLVTWDSTQDLLNETVRQNDDGTETVTVTTSSTQSLVFLRLSVKRLEGVAFLAA